MTLLVPILIGSVQFFLGLLALLITGMAIGNFVTLYWLRGRLEMLEHDVYGCPAEAEPPHTPKKKRSYRRSKKTAKPSTRRVKGKRATGDHRPAWLD